MPPCLHFLVINAVRQLAGPEGCAKARRPRHPPGYGVQEGRGSLACRSRMLRDFSAVVYLEA